MTKVVKDYVNYHPYCLHIWKPQRAILPMPPSCFVGPKEGQSRRDAEREALAYCE